MKKYEIGGTILNHNPIVNPVPDYKHNKYLYQHYSPFNSLITCNRNSFIFMVSWAAWYMALFKSIYMIPITGSTITSTIHRTRTVMRRLHGMCCSSLSLSLAIETNTLWTAPREPMSFVSLFFFLYFPVGILLHSPV